MKTKQTPCQFAERIVHTACQAFLDKDHLHPYEDWKEVSNFNDWESIYEFIDEEIGGVCLIKGTFHYLNQSVPELKMVLEDFDKRGLQYWVFVVDYEEGECADPVSSTFEREFCVYTPNLKHGE